MFNTISENIRFPIPQRAQNFSKDAAKPGTTAAGSSQPPSAAANANPQHISKQTHDALSCIFKLIASKAASQAGIAQLYEFKQQHPDFDIAPFLAGANPVFHKFIEDGLATMAARDPQTILRNRQEVAAAAAAGQQQQQVLVETGQNAVKDADYWMERLKLLRVSCGVE